MNCLIQTSKAYSMFPEFVGLPEICDLDIRSGVGFGPVTIAYPEILAVN